MLQGGCCCGAIRYRAEGAPYHLTHCHCTICRGTSGAPFLAWFSVPRAGFRFVRGIPATYRSSAHAERSFCPACGTQLTFADDGAPHEIDVTIASLDQPEALAPQDHTFVRSKLPWVVLADGLPQHAASRPGP